MVETKKNDAASTNQKPKRKAAKYWFFGCLVLLGSGLWILPSLIAKSELRDTVLNSIANSPDWRISSRGAEFGWLTPLIVEDLEISNVDQSTTISLKRLSCEKSWLRLWLEAPQLGAFQIDDLLIDAVVKDGDQAESSRSESNQTNTRTPQFTATIRQAHIRIRNEQNGEPVVDAQGIDLELDFDNEQKTATFGPQVLFERETLTPELSNQGLQLLAPVLADELDISGAFSLNFTRLQLPLMTSNDDEFSQRAQVEGELVLHEVSAGITNSVTQRLVKMFAELLELGEAPDNWRLADETNIRFQYRDGALEHQAMAIVLPDIAPDFELRSGGTVSISEQIELLVAIKPPVAVLGDHALGRKLAQTPVEIRLSGTIDQPLAGLPADPQWVLSISDDLLADHPTEDEQKLAAAYFKLIGELYRRTKDRQFSLPPELLKRIESIESVKSAK